MPPPDPEVLAATIALYMSEFSNADLDGDGVADFDTDGDGPRRYGRVSRERCGGSGWFKLEPQ